MKLNKEVPEKGKILFQNTRFSFKIQLAQTFQLPQLCPTRHVGGGRMLWFMFRRTIT